ncbi:MAG: bifunctional hydroxymethylpyrimidine kinase/phosphomethylpyrimidine kinase [Rhodobacteraceae bacterium]|nr:bifunctional hydroxymethylpyrimidine kinase/phosphomethylpyrimidine kinase [Paracoccaceae bacterium]
MTNAPIICIGSALWDVIASASVEMQPGNDIPGLIRRRMGGVALNVAVALARSGEKTLLLTAIGCDAEGDSLIKSLMAEGIDCSYITRCDDPTDTYLAVEQPNGNIFAAIADCASLEKAGENILTPLIDGRLASDATPWVGAIVVDGNIPVPVMETLAHMPSIKDANLSFVPASPGKARRMRAALKAAHATLFVNLAEAEIMCDSQFADSNIAASALLALGAARAIVTDGPNSATICTRETSVTLVPPKVNAHSTTGAGDVFLAAVIAAEQTPETTLHSALQAAIDAAAAHISRKPV